MVLAWPFYGVVYASIASMALPLDFGETFNVLPRALPCYSLDTSMVLL